MRAASTALQNFLLSKSQFVQAELYAFTLRSGGQMRYTDGAGDLVLSGNTYSSSGPLFERTSIRETIGVEVDSLTVDAYPRGTADQIGGVDFFTACRTGIFDGARFTLSKLIMPTYGDVSLGPITRFAGRVADIRFDRMQIEFTIKSDLELLNVPFPRNLYQPSCAHTLFDQGCALNKAAYGINATLSAFASDGSYFQAATGAGAGYFDQGTVTFNSGVAAGMSFSIRSSDGTTHYPLIPIPQAITAGTTCTLYPGCDKLSPTCNGKFGNLGHFRGFPFVPAPETAY